jgi:hypothetical protein
MEARQLAQEQRQRVSADIKHDLGAAAEVAKLVKSGATPRDEKEAARWEAIRARGEALQNTPEAQEQRRQQRQVQRQGRGMSMDH